MDDQSGSTSKPLFCPHCGHPVNADEKFCGNCGFDLAAYFASHGTPNGGNSTNEDPSDETPKPANNGDNADTSKRAGTQKSGTEQTGGQSATSQQPKPSQSAPRQTQAPMRRQNRKPMARWKIVTIVVVVVLLIGGYLFGNHYYSKAATMDRIVNRLQSQKGLSSYFTSSDPSLKINSSTLLPLSKYMSSHNQSLASFKSELNNVGATNNDRFIYKQTGHHFLLFPKWQVQVKPVYPEVTTNHKNVTIKLDGKKVAKSTSTSFTKKLGPLVPGQYKLTANGTVNGHNITNSGTYHINSDSDYYNLELKTISFTVQTAPSATVYINGKSQGKADSDGLLDVQEIPFSSNMEVTAKYALTNSSITSKRTKVTDSDDGTTVDVTFPHLLSEDDAQTFLDGFFETVEGVSNSGDMSDATDDNGKSMAEYFEGGSSNSLYGEYEKMAKGYYKDDNIEDVEYSTEIESVYPASDDNTNVQFKLTYDFDNENDEHVQVYEYTFTVKKNGDDTRIVSSITAKKVDDYEE